MLIKNNFVEQQKIEGVQHKNKTNSENDKQLLIDLSCDIKTSKKEEWVKKTKLIIF